MFGLKFSNHTLNNEFSKYFKLYLNNWTYDYNKE